MLTQRKVVETEVNQGADLHIGNPWVRPSSVLS